MMRCKKYLLFADPRAPYARCAFYGSAQGCRNGEKCQFIHSTERPTTSPLTTSCEIKDFKDNVHLHEKEASKEEELNNSDEENSVSSSESNGAHDDNENSEESSNSEPEKEKSHTSEIEELRQQLQAERQRKVKLLSEITRKEKTPEQIEAERLREQIANLRRENERKRKEMEEASTLNKRHKVS